LGVHDLLALIATLVGLGGILFPVLPGLLLQVGAIFVWALVDSSTAGWVVLAISSLIALATLILKIAFPGRKLKQAGVPAGLLLFAVAVGVVGLFVIPIVGGPLAFVGTIYLFEWRRGGSGTAWPSTKTSLIAVAQSIGIELAGGTLITLLLIAGIWLG
jgi:uncharacterized protein YqgC (DUF456 family)